MTRSSSKDVACAMSSPCALKREGRAIEDEAVVAADLVAHEDGDVVAMGNGGEHLAAHFALGVPEGRRGEVDVDGRILAHQLFQRIEGVETARPEVLVVPGIFADGDGEAQTVEFDDLLAAGGQEVALLIEDVVEGQQPLVLFKQDHALVEQDCGVHGRLAGVGRGGQRHACDNGGGKIARGGGEFIDGLAAASEEARFLKEVGGGIAADRQLGKDSEPSALVGGAAGEPREFFRDCR